MFNQIKSKNKKESLYPKRTGGWDKGKIRRDAAKQFLPFPFAVQNNPGPMYKFTPQKQFP